MKIHYLAFFTLLFVFLTHNDATSQAANQDSLLNMLERLKQSSRSFANDTIRIKTLCELGKNEANLNEAEQHFNLALNLAKQLKWKEGEFLSTYLLAKAYNKNSVFLPAINTFYKALFIAEQNHQLSRQGDCLQRIADAYLMLKQFSKATEHYQRTLKIFKSLGSTMNYVDCLNNFSLVFYYQQKYDQALKILYECIRIGKPLRGTIYEASYLSNIASCYRDKKSLDSAVFYFDKTLAVYRLNEGKYNDLLAITLIEQARVYELLGQYDKALEIGLSAYAMNSRFYGNNLYTTEFLSNIYLVKRDFRNALKYHKEYFNAWEKAQKQDRQKQIESLKYEYENKQSGIKIDLLNKDISQRSFQRKILVGGLLFLVFCLIASVWSFKILKTKNNKIESQKKELTRVSSDLEVLNATLEQQVETRTLELTNANSELMRKNAEIEEALYRGQNIERKRVASELHDNLGSTISGLIWQLDGMAIETDVPQLNSTYSSLIDRMREAYTEIRNISHNLYPSELEKYGLENSILRLVDNLNKNSKIRFQFQSSNMLKGLSKQVELELYAICLELLNNVIKHSNAKQALITLDLVDLEMVTLRVSDDGVGISTNKGNGSGFTNLQNRLESIRGFLSVGTENKTGTTVQITIPV